MGLSRTATPRTGDRPVRAFSQWWLLWVRMYAVVTIYLVRASSSLTSHQTLCTGTISGYPTRARTFCTFIRNRTQPSLSLQYRGARPPYACPIVLMVGRSHSVLIWWCLLFVSKVNSSVTTVCNLDHLPC